MYISFNLDTKLSCFIRNLVTNIIILIWYLYAYNTSLSSQGGLGRWTSDHCRMVSEPGVRPVKCKCAQPAHFGLLFVSELDCEPWNNYNLYHYNLLYYTN